MANDVNQQPETAARKQMKASIFCLPSVGSRAEIEAGMGCDYTKT
jgi:hypothetical protein